MGNELNYVKIITQPITNIEDLKEVLNKRAEFNFMELQKISYQIDNENNEKRARLVHENNFISSLLAQIKD